LGRALYRSEAPGRAAATIDTLAKEAPEEESERVRGESHLVALAYLIWPVAIYERIAPRPQASAWYRFHIRQALGFGGAAALWALLALVWPLLASLALQSLTATIAVYALAIVLDIVLVSLWFVLALRYSRRAAAGALFTVPRLPA
jgi:hypothetical protein